MDEFARFIKKRNAIETTHHAHLTKNEILKLIDQTFPDEEVGKHGQVAQLTTTVMSDGTRMQSICFGKILEA